MNRKYLSTTIFGAALLLFAAACTNDELTDGTDALPEGKYPLQIASVTMEGESSAQPWGAKEVQTRVSENEDGTGSVWDGEEKISVQITNDTETAIYTLQTDRTTLTSDKPLYWKNKNAGTVRAWYPADGNVDLSNQTKGNGLAYALFAETENAVDYSTSNITLPFVHKLAKVCVVLQGSDKDKVEDVKIKTFTSCTLNADGTLINGGTEAYIPMVQTTYNNETCWEANVVPNHPITQFQVNGNDGKLNDNGITPEAAKVSKITLTVGAKEITGGQTITDPGDYIIKGDITQGITLQGDGIHLTLDNVTANTGTPIKISGGTSTIILQGNNTLIASGAPAIWLIGENTNVIIKGTENSHLKVSSTDGSAAIGTNYHSYATSEWTPPCGNITIENAFIEASSSYAAAAIGTGVGYQGPGRCGVITIIKSEIKATAVEYLQRGKPAVIGTGGTDGQPMSCAGINITLKDGQNKDEFLNNLTGPYTKVGAGEGLNNASNTCGPINWYNSDGSSAN